MKKLLIVLSLFLSAGWAQAQHETLFGQQHVFGAFGGPLVEYNINNSEVSTSAGGGGGIILGNLFLGGYGLASADQFDNLIENNRVELQMAHGGFWIGAVYPSGKLLHAFSSVKLGWGALDVEIDEDDFDTNDAIFVTTPEIGIEVNLLKWFRVAGTVGYRFTSGVNNTPNLSNEDFSNMVGGVTFRFGAFGNLKNSNKWKQERW